jgi:hypothetical protein
VSHERAAFACRAPWLAERMPTAPVIEREAQAAVEERDRRVHKARKLGDSAVKFPKGFSVWVRALLYRDLHD